MDNLIELKDVTKSYGNFMALDRVSLNIPKGKFVVILGPSGAGKSTLLNLLGGMDSVSSGTIKIDGLEINKLNDLELTKYRARDVGFIFQFYNIMPTLTVSENVLLVGDVTSVYRDVDDVLDSVGLLEHKNKFPSELSGGEQQRVSIARAIMKNPKLLLADEPTGALDSFTGKMILKLLKKQCDSDTTVIVVTHNTLISEIADMVINIKNGTIDKITYNKRPKSIESVRW